MDELRIPRPIYEHGAIGNLSTIALVATDGAVDFMCWPQFDSPSIFAALLDTEVGGVWSIAPEILNARVVQTYVPDSNVLITRWMGDSQSVEVLDLMIGDGDATDSAPRLIRQVRATRGEVRVKFLCDPRPDYGVMRPQVRIGKDEVVFETESTTNLRLIGNVDFIVADGGVSGQFLLHAEQKLNLVLQDRDAMALSDREVDGIIDVAIRRWQDWSARSTYRGRWRDTVMRSALILKLLTSNRFGSIVAAATFGLPEVPGGERNWDYRATWIRDASFSVYALMRLGYQEEAAAFTRWAADRATDCPGGTLQVMYAIDGSQMAAEVTLDKFSGYGGARPVRIGNAAAPQLQLDMFGALMDSIYLSNKYGEAISHADWEGVCRVVDFVCDNWERPDAGIWETRGRLEEHLHSRLMCWVTLDRALRLASKRSLTAPVSRWAETRNAINKDIWVQFLDSTGSHFVRSKGSEAVDGAMLMMPLVRFVASTDPIWLATLDLIGERLGDDGLLFRYDVHDGLEGREGTFAACSFWYVECLARAGRVREAREHFELLLVYGNHLQLYAEEFDARARGLGNFPQALTHLALISAAYCLDRAMDRSASSAEWRA